jgi:hypothetical protein
MNLIVKRTLYRPSVSLRACVALSALAVNLEPVVSEVF